MTSILKWMLKMAAVVGGSIFATSAVNSAADVQQANAVAAAAAATPQEKPFYTFLGKIMPLLKTVVLGFIGLMFFRNIDLKKFKI